MRAAFYFKVEYSQYIDKLSDTYRIINMTLLKTLGVVLLVSTLLKGCAHNKQCSAFLPSHLTPTAIDMTAFLEADPAELFPYQLCRAKNGEQAGQYKVGVAYHEGLGVEQDYKEAKKWYEKAAKPKSDLKWTFNSEVAIRTRPKYSEYKEAQYRLGILYHYGLGVDINQNKAKEWFILASEQGYLPAQAKILQMDKRVLKHKDDNESY